jgi:D-alanyl-D-alanine carboxypeptidase (penicillin-binding protein 5/6)
MQKRIFIGIIILLPITFIAYVRVRSLYLSYTPHVLYGAHFFTHPFDSEPFWNMSDFTPNEDFEVIAKSAFLVDIDSGEVLFDKNSKEKLEIASLAKIMTAVLSLENLELTQEVKIDARSASIGENSMGLSVEEVYTVEELLYGLILASGNDAAYALALANSASTEVFVSEMNSKAHVLGMRDTVFADPSGLEPTKSTGRDLARLTRYALKNPKFRKIVKTVEKELPFSKKHKYVYLYNQTNLLTTYPGVSGVKTGFTEGAGLCLVTYAINEGKELVGVVLDSTDRKGDMILMLDSGFSSLGVEISHNLL